MRRRATFLAVLVSAAGGVTQACGSDDGVSISPPEDAGLDHAAPRTPLTDGAPAPTGDAAGDATSESDAGASDASDAALESGITLDGGACDGGTFTVSGITPKFGHTGSTTSITISGAGFVATPKVYLLDSTKAATQLENAAFVSSSSLTATIPSGLTAGTYDIAVVNPNECASSLAGAFKIVANAPPVVLGVSPAQGTTQNDVPVTITGCNFPANATLQTVSETGVVVEQTESAPAAGTADGRCGADPVYTMAGTILTKTTPMTAGVYLVRVTNPTDATYGEYASFIVSNPSGNLNGGWVASASLVYGRRSLGVASARIDDANRFLYAIGGEDAAGAPLKSVEVAQVDRFGRLGKWSVQKNELVTARSGLSVVQRGLYLYALGGTSSTNGTAGANATNPSGTPLDSAERAKLLLPSGAPKLAAPTPSTSAGTLARGTYYYRVAAVLDGSDPTTAGETLPSDEIAATLSATGQVGLSWNAPAVGSVMHYRVYRTAAPDGASGDEVLLKDALASTTFTDSGADAAGTERPLSFGSTGPWTTVGGTLAHARFNAAAAVAPAPDDALYVFLMGGWGKCGAAGSNSIMDCYEHATISNDGATLGAFVAPAGQTAFNHARMRHGADAMTAENGPSGFAVNADTTKGFVVLSGGKGTSTTANTIEYAVVGSGGVLGTWTKPTGYSAQRDGTQFLIANGYGYAFQGGQAANAYAVTSDQSHLATVSSTTLSFGSWSNAAANTSNKLARHGAVGESAYFYIIGGTTNDTDALTAVYRVLH